jgi:hypothetical protein
MKQWAIHLFYLTIIAFLSYNYWSSVQAFKAFEHLDRQLRVDAGSIEESSERLFRNIQKNCDAYKYAYNMRHYDNTVAAVKAVDSLIAFIDAQKTEFINLNGGLDTVKYFPLINRNSTKTSKNFYLDPKINQFKDKLAQLNQIFTDSIINDNWGKEKLIKQFRLPQLLAENDYWNTFKTLPANAILAKLTALKNQIKIDEIAFLTYEEDETNPNYCGLTEITQTKIAPKKAVLVEGEAFEADIYLATFSVHNNNDKITNLTIKVNGEPLEIHEGVAHFKSKNQTIGTKTIKAEAIIRNPLTGLTKTTEGSFEYQVLPKCSANCQ